MGNRTRGLWLPCMLAALVLTAGCDPGEPSDGDADVDGDADADLDAEEDGDGDAETRSDGDIDSGSDGDADHDGDSDIAADGDMTPDADRDDDCAPDCGERICGDDGCGGSCGACDDGSACDAGRMCALACDLDSEAPVCPQLYRCLPSPESGRGFCRECEVSCAGSLGISCESGSVREHSCESRWRGAELLYQACSYDFATSGWTVRIQTYPTCEIESESRPGLCDADREYCLGAQIVSCSAAGDSFGPLDTCRSLHCVDSTCESGIGCVEGSLIDGFCLIDETCREEGESDPDDRCQVCSTETSTDTWSAGREGEECDDGDPWTADDVCTDGRCAGSRWDCFDVDGDRYGAGSECSGPDCNDSDPECWVEGDECCVDCTDGDGDGSGVGADCASWDCNDADAGCHLYGDECCTLDCIDMDGDGRGLGECEDIDCNDSDVLCWSVADECCSSGASTCAAALSCVNTCAMEALCMQRCFEGASPAAQLRFEALHDCIFARGCSIDDPSCVMARCRDETMACVAG